MPAEMALDQPPASGEIGIASRQRPQAVNVVRQDHDGIDLERVMVHRVAERLAQQGNVFVRTQEWTPVVGDNREKERAAGRSGSAIVHVAKSWKHCIWIDAQRVTTTVYSGSHERAIV